MLVLSRRVCESIVISAEITITVLEVRGTKVKIGIDAPGEVPVHRQEVAEALIANQTQDVRTRKKLLVVSNNPNIRATIASMLAGKASDVDTAHSFTCALEYLDETEYDVAIIDESLRNARGQALFARMKRHQSGLKGILCSDRPTVATVEAALDSGMQHVVQKPIDQRELISLVSN